MAKDNFTRWCAHKHLERALLQTDLLIESCPEDDIPGSPSRPSRPALLFLHAELEHLGLALAALNEQIPDELRWLCEPLPTLYERLVQGAVRLCLNLVVACLLLSASVVMLPVALVAKLMRR